jgi:hypothetical protein
LHVTRGREADTDTERDKITGPPSVLWKKKLYGPPPVPDSEADVSFNTGVEFSAHLKESEYEVYSLLSEFSLQNRYMAAQFHKMLQAERVIDSVGNYYYI